MSTLPNRYLEVTLGRKNNHQLYSSALLTKLFQLFFLHSEMYNLYKDIVSKEVAMVALST